MQNTETVVKFKEALIIELYKYRKFLKNLNSTFELKQQEQTKLISQVTQSVKEKDETIDTLKKTDSNYLKILRDTEVYISANGIAKDQSFTATDFRDFMKSLGLVTQQHRLTYYWIKDITTKDPTNLVIENGEQGTPYFNTKCIDLFNTHRKNLAVAKAKQQAIQVEEDYE